MHVKRWSTLPYVKEIRKVNLSSRIHNPPYNELHRSGHRYTLSPAIRRPALVEEERFGWMCSALNQPREDASLLPHDDLRDRLHFRMRKSDGPHGEYRERVSGLKKETIAHTHSSRQVYTCYIYTYTKRTWGGNEAGGSIGGWKKKRRKSPE